MSDIWMQSRFGKRIDMLDPRAEDVDFREIALTLANSNRYAGAADPSVSIAFHTLLGLDAAPEDIRPWWLLHDAHEAIIGDITTPSAQAIEALVARNGHPGLVKTAIKALKRIHDVAIHAAAGLPMPSPEQKAEIRRLDLVSLATERRDFMVASPHPWEAEYESAIPIKHVYQEGHFGWRPMQVAMRLHQRFAEYFPALAIRRAA